MAAARRLETHLWDSALFTESISQWERKEKTPVLPFVSWEGFEGKGRSREVDAAGAVQREEA